MGIFRLVEWADKRGWLFPNPSASRAIVDLDERVADSSTLGVDYSPQKGGKGGSKHEVPGEGTGRPHEHYFFGRHVPRHFNSHSDDLTFGEFDLEAIGPAVLGPGFSEQRLPDLKRSSLENREPRPDQPLSLIRQDPSLHCEAPLFGRPLFARHAREAVSGHRSASASHRWAAPRIGLISRRLFPGRRAAEKSQSPIGLQGETQEQ